MPIIRPHKYFRRQTLQPITVPQITTESLNNPIKFEEYGKEDLIKEEEERLKSFKVKLKANHFTKRSPMKHIDCLRK